MGAAKYWQTLKKVKFKGQRSESDCVFMRICRRLLGLVRVFHARQYRPNHKRILEQRNERNNPSCKAPPLEGCLEEKTQEG
eukprot:4900137-Amphidinium_carterae.1